MAKNHWICWRERFHPYDKKEITSRTLLEKCFLSCLSAIEGIVTSSGVLCNSTGVNTRAQSEFSCDPKSRSLELLMPDLIMDIHYIRFVTIDLVPTCGTLSEFTSTFCLQ